MFSSGYVWPTVELSGNLCLKWMKMGTASLLDNGISYFLITINSRCRVIFFGGMPTLVPFSMWLIHVDPTVQLWTHASRQVATMVATVGACAAPTAAMVGVGPSHIPPTTVSVMATCDSDPAEVVQIVHRWYHTHTHTYIYIYMCDHTII